MLGTKLDKWEALLDQCQAAARQAFEKDFKFWNAVMPMDAEVTRCLLNGSLATRIAELASGYKEAMAPVAASSRQLDSVISQWQMMASFLKLAGRKKEADALIELVGQLGGGATPATEGAARPAAAKPTRGRTRPPKEKAGKA